MGQMKRSKFSEEQITYALRQAESGSPMRDFLATGSDEYSGAWVPGSSRYVYLTNKNGEEKLRIHSRNENWDRLIVGNHGFDGTIVKSAPAASPETP